MSDAFERTVDLLATHGQDVLRRSLRRGGLIGDIYAEDSVATSMSLRMRRGRPTEHRRVKRDFGAGVRVFDEDGSAYTSGEDLSLSGFEASADATADAFRSSASSPRSSASSTRSCAPSLHSSAPSPREVPYRGQSALAAGAWGDLETFGALPPDTLDSVATTESSSLLHRAADAALSLIPDLFAVTVTLQGRSSRFAVASSDGRFVRSVGSTIALRVHLRRNDGVEVHAVGGGSGGVGLFFARPPEDVAREAAERLASAPRPGEAAVIGGEYPVVVGGGWGGVWLHEVIGHALEADVEVNGALRIGERVAGEGVTVVDDPNLAAGRGGAPIDDEGSMGRRSVLIDRGVLRCLLTDRATALRRGLPETGNGRRQDYRHEPMPRMTNLTLEPGSATPDELIHEAGRGLYVKMIGGGRVIPSKDRFSFDVLEGYEIEGGRLGRPVSGFHLEGRSSTMLKRVGGVADDFKIDPGRGTCEKRGQVVPVSVGMPTILVERMTIAPLGHGSPI